jgi:hypothetical protein
MQAAWGGAEDRSDHGKVCRAVLQVCFPGCRRVGGTLTPTLTPTILTLTLTLTLP